MGQRTDDLFKEILNNVRNDREKVTLIRDRIVNLVSSDESIMTLEPLAILGVAENVATLSDVLTKMNSQLVELTKVSVKTDTPVEDSEKDKDSIFDEIESSGSSIDASN